LFEGKAFELFRSFAEEVEENKEYVPEESEFSGGNAGIKMRDEDDDNDVADSKGLLVIFVPKFDDMAEFIGFVLADARCSIMVIISAFMRQCNQHDGGETYLRTF